MSNKSVVSSLLWGGVFLLCFGTAAMAADVSALVSQARVQVDSQSYDAAEGTLKRALSKQKDNLEARFLLARISELREDYRGAIKRYKYLLFLKPKQIPAMAGIARSAEKLGDAKLARKTYLNISRQEPDQMKWLFEAMRIELEKTSVKYNDVTERRLKTLIQAKYREPEPLKYLIDYYHSVGAGYKAKKYEKMLTDAGTPATPQHKKAASTETAHRPSPKAEPGFVDGSIKKITKNIRPASTSKSTAEKMKKAPHLSSSSKKTSKITPQNIEEIKVKAAEASGGKATTAMNQKIQLPTKQLEKPDIQLTEPLREVEQNSEVWEWVVPPEFDELEFPDENSSFIVVKKGRKRGVYDTKGNVIAVPEYDYFRFGSDSIFSFKTGKQCGYMDGDGKVVIQPMYKFCPGFSDGIAPARGGDDYKAGFIDSSGKLLSKRYNSLDAVFSDGLALAQNEGEKCGYLNRHFEFQIPQQFTKCQTFHEGLAAVYNEQKLCGYIDTTGKMVIKPEYAVCGEFSEGLAFVKTGKKAAAVPNNSRTVDETFFIDKTGKKAFGARLTYKGPTFTITEYKKGPAKGFISGVTLHSSDVTSGFVEYLSSTSPKFQEGLMAVGFYPDNNKRIAIKTASGVNAWVNAWYRGFINRSGEFVVPPIYADVGGAYHRFNDDIDGYAQVALTFGTPKKEKLKSGEVIYIVSYSYYSGFVGTNGTPFLTKGSLSYWKNNRPIKADSLDVPLGSRLQHWVSKNLSGFGRRVGYIDVNGKTVIPPQFGGGSDFKNGLAIVEVGDKYGVIKLKKSFVDSYGSIAKDNTQKEMGAPEKNRLAADRNAYAIKLYNQYEEAQSKKGLAGADIFHKGDRAQFVEAIEFAAAATELNPASSDYWRLLGNLYSKIMGNPLAETRAEEALAKAVRLNPKDLKARLLLGQILYRQGFYKGALDNLEYAVNAEPFLANAQVVAIMNNCYLLDMQSGRGIKFFGKLLKKKPHADAARIALAILFQQQGKQPQAEQILQPIISERDKNDKNRRYALQLVGIWDMEAALQ